MEEKIILIELDVMEIPSSDHVIYLNESNYIGYIDNHTDRLTITGIVTTSYFNFLKLINKVMEISVNGGYTHIYINNYLSTVIIEYLITYGFEAYTYPDNYTEFILNLRE